VRQLKKPKMRLWPRVEMAVILLVGVLLTGWAQTTPTSNPLLDSDQIFIGIDGKPYTPMTDAEVQNYLKKVTPEMLFADIKKLDLIEHVRPMISMPQAVVGVTKNDIIFLGWGEPGKLNIDVAGQLSYSLQLKPEQFPNQIKRDSPLKIILGLVVGVAVAGFGQYGLDLLDPTNKLGIAKPCISMGVGFLFGGGLYLIL
jgi:hypothetical protein